MRDDKIKKWLVFEEERPCPLCGCLEYVVLSNKMQFRLNCRTVICQRCSFCFVSPMPKEEVMKKFYQEDYANFYKKIHTDNKLGSIYGESLRKLSILEKYVSLKDKNFLEIGAGTGGFLEVAQKKFRTCSAVEPSLEFKKYLTKKGIEIIADFLETIPSQKKYDVVGMFQVMEHLRDPVLAMNKIRSILSEKGIIIIDVPNIMNPFRSLDRYYLRYVHLSYFSENTLSMLLTENGFEILYMESGRNKSFMIPDNIFIVAKLQDGDTKESSKIDYLKYLISSSENERYAKLPGIKYGSAENLLKRLRRYRLTYTFLDAPRFYCYIMGKSIRRIVSQSPIGSIYRKLKLMFNSNKRTKYG